MGSGLFNPPPPLTDPGQFPVVPVPDFVATGQAVATGVKKASWWVPFWRIFWSTVIDGIHEVLEILAGGFDDIIAAWLKVVGGLKGTNQPGFFNLIATVLSGQLGVTVDAGTIQAAFQSGGSVPAMRTIGGNVFQAWASIIAPGGGAGLTGSGVAAAEGFMGWLIEFAIKHGNMAVLGSLIPEEWRILDGISEYGTGISQALGLGRLSRQAFQPLMKILIADPLTRDLNTAFSPKQLSEGELVRAFVRGLINAGTLRQQLGQLGYAYTWDDALIAEHSKSLDLRQLMDFLRFTGQAGNVPIGALQQLGYSPTDAANLWSAGIESLVDPLRKQFLNELTNELRKGEIDLGTATSLLNSTSLFPQEAGWYQQIWSQMLAFPRKRLSEAQVEKAFVEGLIDMTTVQNYWIQSGYGADAIQVLTLLLLQRLQGGTKTTSGHTPHAHLTEAEIQKALKDGVIGLPQAQAYWQARGFSPVDVQILTALYGGTSPGTPPIVSGTPN